MKHLSQTKQFAKDVKLAKKRGKDLGKLRGIVLKLAKGEMLDARQRDHPLIGE